MEIRCLYILIGFIITLNSTAQDISKPDGISPSQKEPDKSKEKTSSKADTPIQKTYNTNSSLYQQELTAEDMFKKGEEYEDTSDYAKAVKWYQKAAGTYRSSIGINRNLLRRCKGSTKRYCRSYKMVSKISRTRTYRGTAQLRSVV